MFDASLILLAFILVIGPIGICNESCGFAYWFSSFPLSLKEFDLKSSPTSKG
jgi:hypothetical protein